MSVLKFTTTQIFPALKRANCQVDERKWEKINFVGSETERHYEKDKDGRRAHELSEQVELSC